MKRQRNIILQLCVLMPLVLSGIVIAASATEPTLARLSFWVPPERMEEFESAYEKQIVPILNEHGLMESPVRGRTTADSVFSRLFAFAALAEMRAEEQALRKDSMWRAELHNLGATFGTVPSDSLLRASFRLYTTPAGPGQTVEAGAGFRQGLWQSFGIQDGLPSPLIYSIVEDREGNLWFGTGGGGVSRYDGTRFTTFTTEDGLASNIAWAIMEDREGNLWFGTEGGVSRYDGKEFITFTTEEGLANNHVRTIEEDREGHLWFGTEGGVSRYDGKEFITFSTKEGLASNSIESIQEDREENLWFGTEGGGVSRYDGKEFITFTATEGLANNYVLTIMEDREGRLWFATLANGVSRYDGAQFATFTTKEGLPNNSVQTITEDREGNLWFGTFGNVSRYDGEEWSSLFTGEDQIDTFVKSIVKDREGSLWLGTQDEGVIRYDGKTFTTFTTEDGLASNTVWAIMEDREGRLWFATLRAGVSRYDGKEFTTFTTDDGLVSNAVLSILEDREGDLWFGTFGGGVSHYDGLVFQTLSRQDGLVNDAVQDIFQDPHGDMWIATEGGITRYRPTHTPPSAQILNVTTDRPHGPVAQVELPSSQDYLLIEFQGMSMHTPPERMVYLYRLEGYNDTWQQTRTGQVEYTDLPLGEYAFQVKAVDRDLNYSEPTTVSVQVHLPYERIGWLSALSIAMLLVAYQSTRVIRRDHRLRELNIALSDANKELFAFNQELQRERAVERIQGQVQAMEQASDFDNVLSVLTEELKAVGLHFGSCGIDVLDEPVDEPTMAYFEDHGFRYTTYDLDPEGAVTQESYSLSAPFPPVTRKTIERFVAGEPWQGRSEQTTIAEVPISDYGRLRLTASDRQEFAEKEITTLQDFATAIALGYVRYLDFQRLEKQNQALQQKTEDLEKANQEIQEATRRKSDFLARMSHDLRTPMNAIIGYTRILLRRLKDSIEPRQLRNLENIDTSSHNLLNLINEILDLSRVQAGRIDVNPQDVDLKQLATECATSVESLIEPGVELIQRLDDVPVIHTDPDVLRKVLMNLLSNAVKFTEEGSITLSVRPADGGIELAVADTGVGIPAADLPHIFDEFQQVERQGSSEKEGTGLGLAIAKKSVELLGGTVEAESEVGKGTIFRLKLRDYES